MVHIRISELEPFFCDRLGCNKTVSVTQKLHHFLGKGELMMIHKIGYKNDFHSFTSKDHKDHTLGFVILNIFLNNALSFSFPTRDHKKTLRKYPFSAAKLLTFDLTFVGSPV